MKIEQVNIRAITPADIDSIMSIDAVSFVEAWTRTLWEKELSRSDRVYLAVSLKEQLIGYVGGLVIEKDFHITTIATKTDFRSQGVASFLLQALLKELIQMPEEIDGVTLEVRASNESAKALYRKFGFAPVGIRRGYYQSNGEDALIMWLHGLSKTSFLTKLQHAENLLALESDIQGVS